DLPISGGTHSNPRCSRSKSSPEVSGIWPSRELLLREHRGFEWVPPGTALRSDLFVRRDPPHTEPRQSLCGDTEVLFNGHGSAGHAVLQVELEGSVDSYELRARRRLEASGIGPYVLGSPNWLPGHVLLFLS